MTESPLRRVAVYCGSSSGHRTEYVEQAKTVGRALAQREIGLVYGGGGIGMMGACGIVLSLSFWGGVSRSWPQARAWLRRLPKGEMIERSLDSCRRFGQDKLFLARALGLSMALNAASVAQVMVLAVGMGLQIAPLALFVIVPIITCLSALPITPSGLGVRENLYVQMLATPEINVGATQALSLSLLAYACNLAWSVVGGIVYLSLKDAHQLAEIGRPEAAAEQA